MVTFYSRLAAIIVLGLACCTCSRPPQGVLVPSAFSAEGTSRVPIFVATTRSRSTNDAGDMFSGESSPVMSYAAITVSLPPESARKIGQIQWPTSLPGDPARDFVTTSAAHIDEASFKAKISELAESSGRSRVLVFVHGYNNRFDEAVYRLAQIVNDSKAPVLPVLFSWPSRGMLDVSAYRDDLESAHASRAALRQLLITIAANRDVREITILCHSMGCWPALDALQPKEKVRNLLLVAPDVDVEIFQVDFHHAGNPKPRVAIFISQDDMALNLSKLISSGRPRLGNVNPYVEPYRSIFERNAILVFDISHLQGDAHSRAFEDISSVMGLIERRLAEGQALTDSAPTTAASSQ
jgi:esterase/lipase superfamily enzyme